MRSLDSPIELEVLRAQLLSIAEQAADTVVRTAISPVVNEAKDCGVAILDGNGGLVTGGGMASLHWVAAVRAVQATLARYGDDVGPGDVFVANDPYNGGGMHPADTMIQRPVFLDGSLFGWVALSAHMIDMGGMSIGSWAPHATECYQEALRLPPLRLVRAGVDVLEIWDMLRVNVRFFDLVEMDIRSLIAGGFVAEQRLQMLVGEHGVTVFTGVLSAMVTLSERELRRRISLIEPGEYHVVGWTEWGDRSVRTPCRLVVQDDRLIFDFSGADVQIPFFINTQPYTIKALFMPLLMVALAPDLPFNEGVLRPIELICPVGSVTSSIAPAPMNCAHIHLSGTTSQIMQRCLHLALWASGNFADRLPPIGADGFPALATNAWYSVATGGINEAWMIVDGCMTGGYPSPDDDGTDFTMKSFDLPQRDQSQPNTFDVETYETWFPMMMRERRSRPGSYGAGRRRAGAALSHSFEPYHTNQVVGQMIGTRGRLPLGGEAGGRPGAVTRFTIVGADGGRRPVAMSANDVVLQCGERFEVDAASCGGWGDPLDRDPVSVHEDVQDQRLSASEAASTYGVIIASGACDLAATEEHRAARRLYRLARARPPASVPAPHHMRDPVHGDPLYPGVVQRGTYAYSVGSGALLAVCPSHWTDGCPVLEEEDEAYGVGLLLRSYLDPLTGVALLVEAVPAGSPRSFACMPTRWIGAVGDSDSKRNLSLPSV